MCVAGVRLSLKSLQLCERGPAMVIDLVADRPRQADPVPTAAH